jgi:intracellular multiplication protein IcmL
VRRPGPHPAAAPLLNEDLALAKFGRLKKIVAFQTWVIAGLGFLVIITAPFAHPINLYYAINPAKQTMQMAGLTMPNMTNRAVLSWAVNSITEIMTMGFGDMDSKLPKQRVRFTSDGWDAYITAFIRGKIGSKFKENQLVLTTVPSNTPVITAQGVNEYHVYQWMVQMPVIMTYATNNNVTSQKRAIVQLIITRVDSKDSPYGIAIDKWAME